MSSDAEHAEYLRKLHEFNLEKESIRLKQGLPHLHAFKYYKWSRRFFESRKKEVFLIAANQVGKSTVQIQKNIHWATEKSLWKKLWPHLTPNQFWYLYPSADFATAEYHTKWTQFLPSGEFKRDLVYGWKAEMNNGKIHAVHFNSGVSIYFKSYSQKAIDLQGGSVFYLSMDEELPTEHLGELQNRLNATDGYMSKVFTATLGQDYWRRTMEPLPGETENHPDALKIQVSLYDCLQYEDGTPSHWTLERIKRIEAKQPTLMDVQIRVHGKFAKPGGRKYESYDPAVNRSENHPLPKDWLVYSGVDIGSGGETGHPAAICFVAVDPLFRRGRVFRAWRGDGVKTTSGDIFVKYLELRAGLKVTQQFYDWSSSEFQQVAAANGESFEPAQKSHEVGARVINTLFKHQMLSIQHGDEELDKMSSELVNLLAATPKKDASDDFCFAGETLVSTSTGDRRIDEIQLGEMVLTRNGYRRVLAKTCALSYAMNLVNEQGVVTWVTGNHQYITASGLVKAKDLQGAECWGLPQKVQQRFASLEGSSSEGTRRARSSRIGDTLLQGLRQRKWVGRAYTKRFGNTIAVQSKKALLFTTLMGMHLIISLRTLSVLVPAPILSTTWPTQPGGPNLEHQWISLERLQAGGMGARMANDFTLGLVRSLGKIRNTLSSVASSVVQSFLLRLIRPIQQSFVLTPAKLKTEETWALTTSRKIVWSVKSPSLGIDLQKHETVPVRVLLKVGHSRKLCLVYNITVEQDHEYFANGVLVANCDSLRYATTKIPWDFSALEGLVPEPLVQKHEETEEDRRRGNVSQTEADSMEEEFAFWNETYDP